MLLTAVILILLVLLMASLGSRNNDYYHDNGYDDDPYYYYPRNAPPRYSGGYQQPYYPQPYQSYPQPYPQPYNQPYPQPFQQPYMPSSRRPVQSGNPVLGIVMFMITVACLFTLATKLGIISGSITFGSPSSDTPAWESLPTSRSGDGGYNIYSKDKPKN